MKTEKKKITVKVMWALAFMLGISFTACHKNDKTSTSKSEWNYENTSEWENLAGNNGKSGIRAHNRKNNK